MRFINLFPNFIHIITPTLILLFVITSSYFVVTVASQLFIFIFKGPIVIGPSSFFLEHCAYPNRKTSLDPIAK
jgi:hypothetical protein